MASGRGKAYGLAFGLALLMFASRPRRAIASTPEDECKNLEYFGFDEGLLRAEIAKAIAAGWRSHQTISIAVMRSVYPTYPGTSVRISVPPSSNDDADPDMIAEVFCLWDRLRALVIVYLQENGIPPWPRCPDGMELDLKAGQCVPSKQPEPEPEPEPVDELPPIDWETIESDGDFPDPGTFVQGRRGDIFLGTYSPARKPRSVKDGKCPQGYFKSGSECAPKRSLVYSTLLSAGWMAGVQYGGLDPDAPGISEAERDSRLAQLNEFAKKVATDVGNRLDYLILIYCSPYNDALYGTYGHAGNLHMANAPHGRAMRLLAMHADNRKRLRLNQPARRQISLGSASSPGDGSGTGPTGVREFFWLPMINLKVLWESGGTIVTTQDVTWPDGSNGIMPPPEVLARGVENVPEGMWGCLGFETSIVNEPQAELPNV